MKINGQQLTWISIGLLILCLAQAAILLSGHWPLPLPLGIPDKEQLAQVEPWPEGEAVVKGYVIALASADLKQAMQYLSGEAEVKHQSVIGQPTEAVILRKILWGDRQQLSQDLGIIKAQLITEAKGVKDYFSYQYLLFKQDNHWKIAQISSWEDSAPCKGNVLDPEALATVNDTMDLIAQGKWQQASLAMSGSAKAEATRTLALGQKPLLADLQRRKSQVILGDSETCWVKTSHQVLEVLDQFSAEPREIILLWQLRRYDPVWSIEEIHTLGY